MKPLRESLLDDEEDLLSDQSTIIKEWILQHYSKDTFRSEGNKELNLIIHNGIVDAPNDELRANTLLESLTNGLFVFGNVKSFNCSHCKNIKSLNGAPKHCEWEFDCSSCDKLTDLEGAPESATVFDCSFCRNLKSLTGCPKKVNIFRARMCDSLTSLEGGPEVVEKAPMNGTTFEFTNCANLKTLDGNLKKVKGLVFLYFDDCEKLTSIEALSNADIDPESYISVCGCKKLKSLKGCPRQLYRLQANECKSLINLEGAPLICGELTVNNCTKLTSLDGAPILMDGTIFAMNCRNLVDITAINNIQWLNDYNRIYLKNSKKVDPSPIPMDIRKKRIYFKH